MKKTLLTIFALAIAAGPLLGEDEQDKPKQPKNRPQAAPRQVNRAPQMPKVQQNVKVSPRFQSSVNTPPTNRVYTPPANVQARSRTFTPEEAARIQSPGNLPSSNVRTRNRRNNPPVVNPQPTQPPTTIAPPTAPTVPPPDTNGRNRDWRNRDGQNRDQNNTNRNWQNNNNRNWQNYKPSGTYTYSDARRHHHRQRHNRSWWRSRYSRIALFAGGYYYWNNNYWYPAYGYDPYYSNYTYDEPIYGYDNLPPGQVIANVQTALQEQGYYQDAVDGLIGPRTRAALSDFQRDNGLPITAAIDGPTLKALGLY